MDGIGLFTYETFKQIVLKNPSIEFIFIFDRKPHHDFIFANNVKIEVIGPQARHPLLYIFWYQYALHKLLKKVKPSIFIGTDGMIPLKSTTKTLAVIHDLNFEHHPEHLPQLIRKYYCHSFPKFAEKANRIATVSEFSKQDIVNQYNINPSKIDVVYNGANSNFKPLSETEKKSTLGKYSHNKDYFLFVGTLHPRKNLSNLFKAFDLFKTNTGSELKLLIVGKKMWWTKEIETTFNQLKHQSDVIFTDRVSETELCKITAAAFALTYIPIFEGFGIPLVEAMNCGTPIITSNVTSMPEVVGDAAILVDPFSVKDIANGMEQLFIDKTKQNLLIEKGNQQGKKYSWDRTSELLWNSIEKTITNDQ